MHSYLYRLDRDQRGITGLETAIILIAFVVVASVFAYTVLSAGLFSSERGKEAIYAGLENAAGTMEVVGSVKATSVAASTLHDADSGWTGGDAAVTDATNTSDYKQGTSSRQLTIGAGLAASTLAYYVNLGSTVDLSSHYSVQLWVKSSITTAAGDLQLVLDDTSGCGSPTESIDLPALTANTWANPVLDIATPGAALNAVACVGIHQVTDVGALTLYVDKVEAPAEVTSISFVVANALDGEPINLTATTDADSDGLLSDEGTKNHELTSIYLDKDQRTADMTWTATQLGKGDGDVYLEPGEKMLITVTTTAANPMPVGGTEFTLVLARGSGADLTIQRTLPANLSTQMDLN
jgi:flagellin-like protein